MSLFRDVRFALRQGGSTVLTSTAVTALLAAIALVASYLPARRALRIDPLVALRRE